jgi:hypothetical protein
MAVPRNIVNIEASVNLIELIFYKGADLTAKNAERSAELIPYLSGIC